MQWINNNCFQVKYIVKVDDDMFVNIFVLIEYFLFQIYKKEKVIMCLLKENRISVIVRNFKSKWNVLEYIFKN